MTQQTLLQALQAEKAGDFITADKLCDEALAQGETYEALVAAARIARRILNIEKVAQRLAAAFKLQPSATLRFELAASYLDANRVPEAEALMREGLKKRSKEFAFVNLYGVILKRMGRYEEAAEYFIQAAKLDGRNISPPLNLGNTYLMLNKPAKAIECFSKATRLAPQDGENYRLLANAHSRLGEYDKARIILEQALTRSPKNLKARIDIAGMHVLNKEYDTALQYLDQGLTYYPDFPELIRNKAIIYRRKGENDLALKTLEDLLKKAPNDSDTLAALGDLHYQTFGDREKANGYYARALELNPNNVKAAMQYCECLVNSRYGNEADHIAKAYEVAIDLLNKQKDLLRIADAVQGIFLRMLDYESFARLGDRKKLLRYWLSQMNVGELHNQLSRVETMEDRLELVALHREWGQKVDEIAAKHPVARPLATSGSGKIRIGIMSSDLRNHPVTYFALPILRDYDRSKFEIYCYSFYQKAPDSVQEKLSKIVDSFNCIPLFSDTDIVKKMMDDKLDILFELGGTTLMNKVELCSYRPAPVQVSWLGYPHSAGLETIDYILTDPYITPEDKRLLIEKPFVMPETWVALSELGFTDIPIEPGIPEQRNGWITFGTANNPYKYTPKVFETWAAIMRQVPNSRFLFIRPEGAVKYFMENAYAHFGKHGIERERILFTPVRGKHMPHYNNIDIALDPFPHVGGTTTCETIWMGVPAITLVGPAFFERLSYSNLSNAGLGELCAFDIPTYIQKAVALAQDKEKRLYLRHNLRKQIRENPLGQPIRFVRNFENKILEVLGKS